MSMPKISDINPDISITREEAVNIIIASIAMEELSLAHIMNAEGEKLQYVLGTLEEGNKPDEVTICDIMAVNNSIQKTLRDVIKTEMLLQFKLEDAIELSEHKDECKITIKGQKIWRDGNNATRKRPASVEIRLLRDGVVYGKPVTVSSTGNGKFSFACLPVSNNSGKKYTYTVDETVPTGYKKKVEGFNIINIIEPGVITINGTKTWDDNNNVGTKRPDFITINLLQNGVQFKSKTIPNDAADFSFDVPQFDNEGTPFDYTVDEDEVEDYDKSIKGYHITNTLKIYK